MRVNTLPPSVCRSTVSGLQAYDQNPISSPLIEYDVNSEFCCVSTTKKTVVIIGLKSIVAARTGVGV